MDDWVIVEVAGSEPEAELLCSVLRGAGIECLPRLTNFGAGAGDGLSTGGRRTSWSARRTRKTHARSCTNPGELHTMTAGLNQASAVHGLKCADLVDAMGRLHRHRCHILDLVTPTPGRVLFGPAVTITYFPSCAAALDPERYNLANLFYEAVGDEPAGKVIVLGSNGYTDTSMGGGTKLLRLHQNGCAGVLTDGRLRDFDELARYDFAAYCSGEASRWGGDSLTPFQANVPVVLQAIGVVPGQYVFADSSGAVLIPDGQIDEVLAEARKVEATDAASRDQISREQVHVHDRLR
jgi:4-hydroxy-4-methyl-2-oxoglutarate aldolase